MPGRMGVTGMTGTNEPNPEVWQQLFASLTGEAGRDAAIIREFCAKHAVTPAEVMREMLAHRRAARQQGRDQSGHEREVVPSEKR
jgi:hypothetical protein